MNEEPVLDFVGNPITPGCTVCYAARRGSDLWLGRMVVTQVRKDGLTGHNREGRTTHIKTLKNCVVVNPPEPR